MPHLPQILTSLSYLKIFHSKGTNTADCSDKQSNVGHTVCASILAEYVVYICRTHIEGRSLIEGRFPHRGPISLHIEGRFIFPTSRAKIVIYARSGCIVSSDVRVFGAVTSRSKQIFY